LEWCLYLLKYCSLSSGIAGMPLRLERGKLIKKRICHWDGLGAEMSLPPRHGFVI